MSENDFPTYIIPIDVKFEPVAKDHRGETWRILFSPGDREALLIFTKKGFYRGGHSHSRPEISVILNGYVRSYKMVTKFHDLSKTNPYQEELVREISAGGTMYNAAGEPHVTLALEDYWLLDFKIDSKIGEWTNTNYPPYRKLVDEQNPKP